MLLYKLLYHQQFCFKALHKVPAGSVSGCTECCLNNQCWVLYYELTPVSWISWLALLLSGFFFISTLCFCSQNFELKLPSWICSLPLCEGPLLAPLGSWVNFASHLDLFSGLKGSPSSYSCTTHSDIIISADSAPSNIKGIRFSGISSSPPLEKVSGHFPWVSANPQILTQPLTCPLLLECSWLPPVDLL